MTAPDPIIFTIGFRQAEASPSSRQDKEAAAGAAGLVVFVPQNPIPYFSGDGGESKRLVQLTELLQGNHSGVDFSDFSPKAEVLEAKDDPPRQGRKGFFHDMKIPSGGLCSIGKRGFSLTGRVRRFTILPSHDLQ